MSNVLDVVAEEAATSLPYAKARQDYSKREKFADR
jgi:hypothetical protein